MSLARSVRRRRFGESSWVIVGARAAQRCLPMHPDWARSLRDECVEAGVAFHFKQWGEWVSSRHMTEEAAVRAIAAGPTRIPPERVHQFDPPERDGHMYRVCKKAAGLVLDGHMG